MAPVVSNQVSIAFHEGDLLRSQFEGWIADRMQINVEKRLLTLDLNMILDPFENRPGKQWWAGEHVGKYLHAATHAWRYTGDERLKSRMDETARRLIARQLENGYLGTYKDSDQFRQGDGLGWDGPVWDVWTHKYALIGLLTYYQATADQASITACRQSADLMYDHYVTRGKSLRLASSHLGMAATSVLESIAILYRETGESRYLEFCHRIVQAWEDESDPETWMYEDGCRLLTSLLDTGDVYRTANRKAYEMLSNLVGLLELYRIDPDERYLRACLNAWNDIASKRLYITGTASYFEQFTQDGRMPPGQAVGEGCVTVTWLQLTKHLFELTGDVQYADEIERTIYNALPAAQSPLTGEVSYFAPLVGQKHYNGHDVKLTPAISCCSSSIPRGLAMIPLVASGTLNGHPALLQYIPGRHVMSYHANDEQKKVTLTVKGDFPQSGDFEVGVTPESTERFTLVLRVPPWADGYSARINGSESLAVPESRLIEIDREWQPGDTITVNMPLDIRTVPHTDVTSDAVAFVRGPQVLATDTALDGSNVPDGNWWGNHLHSHTTNQDGKPREFHLVAFADAGQHKEAYSVLHDGVAQNES
ncbi:MAG: hypothetical protein CMQ05_08825 [Gammaproteobacteria bacterium]|uniref:Glycosyl hydrolase n=1 Tax=OM182 bacterium MED-G24 TaxID=1986255 RepID=A0A2A5WW63_9GAMM|nr:hypothetical protein [Gammaproteobacteria bacterium]PDH40503.1 MAG: hypothetical protein CNE99_03395 [OM182 bacterium MED-G24]RPG24455.1 MAG: hypothetical protein CBC10_011610 [Gammaproteobacteria bacterium TMED50]|tara:strand:+ start:2668 stop:4446 length:1779 start_codon:yes stop_codon:yes gene_type:complete